MTAGQPEQVGGRWRVRFTRRLGHPPEKVWRALTGLGAHLDGGAADTEWSAVHPGYVERFGPEAATIGPPEGLA